MSYIGLIKIKLNCKIKPMNFKTVNEDKNNFIVPQF